jgi:hypothetical protein
LWYIGKNLNCTDEYTMKGINVVTDTKKVTSQYDGAGPTRSVKILYGEVEYRLGGIDPYASKKRYL